MGSKKGGTGKKGGKKIGRKKRKMAFQRYKVLTRFMRGIRKHVKAHPNDRRAAATLDVMENCGSWVRWREARKTGRDPITGEGLPGRA